MPVTEKPPTLKATPKVLDPTFVCNIEHQPAPVISSDEADDDDDDDKESVVFSDETAIPASLDVMGPHYAADVSPLRFNSFLKPNSKFVGIQQSGKAKFNIKVEFKYVDLMNSFLVGFLQINGLTEHHPEITTCFKGEIINNHLKNQCDLARSYSFTTENKKWDSDFHNDMEHWKKLTGYYYLNDEQFTEKLKHINNGTKDSGLIYMRWKEEFLLPDARVKQIAGASFEGFYYIVLNVGNTSKSNLPIGAINGLYYHRSSEKFQSLSLSNLDDDRMSQEFSFM